MLLIKYCILILTHAIPFQFFALPSSFQFLNVATVVGGATAGASLPHHLCSRSAGGLWWFEDRGSVMEPQSGFLVSSAIWLLSPSMASFLARRSSLKTFRVGSIRFSFMGCSWFTTGSRRQSGVSLYWIFVFLFLSGFVEICRVQSFRLCEHCAGEFGVMFIRLNWD